MSYTWTQISAPMTSLLVLERALYSLGGQFTISASSNPVLKELRQAQNNLSNPQTTAKDRIKEIEKIIQLIHQIESVQQLPREIKVGYLRLRYENFRYVIIKRYEGPGLDPERARAEALMLRLNNAYEKEKQKLMDTEVDLKTEIQHINKTIEEKEQFDRLMLEMRKSHTQSIKLAKEKIFQTINENAEKEGYSVKRSKFKKGKNAGREQYIIVKRS